MKRILSVLLLTISTFAFAQVPQGLLNQPPSSPQNALVWSFLGAKTFVDKVAYEAYAEANTHVTETDVVFIGDSITQNWYSFHHDFFDRNAFIARGIGGQTSIGVLGRFRQDVVKHHPKVVALMIGTNDVAQNDGAITLESYLDNVASMCDIARANGIKVLLCSITPCDKFWNPNVEPGPTIINFNEKLQEYAVAEGIQYVDYYSALSNGKDGMVDEYTSDRCHPTPLGYNVMERIIVKEINKALGTNNEYFVTPE